MIETTIEMYKAQTYSKGYFTNAFIHLTGRDWVLQTRIKRIIQDDAGLPLDRPISPRLYRMPGLWADNEDHDKIFNLISNNKKYIILYKNEHAPLVRLVYKLLTDSRLVDKTRFNVRTSEPL